MSIRKVSDRVRRFSRKLSLSESALRLSISHRPPKWVKKNNEWVLRTEDGEHVTLMSSNNEKIPMKDFGAEVRASMDVDYFIQQAVLLLDISETSQDGIINIMLQKLLAEDEPHCPPEEAMSALVTSDSVHLLAHTIQGTCATDFGGFDYDQSWLCAMCNMPSLQKKRIAIARLKHPVNMGSTSQEVRLFILVLCPTKAKETKNALETGRTFGTIFCDLDLRQRLLETQAEEEFKRILLSHTRSLSMEQSAFQKLLEDDHAEPSEDASKNNNKWCRFGADIKDDIFRRLPHYVSDYHDGVKDAKSVQKLMSTTMFLYFACILPAIAFGVLNDNNTYGKIDVKRTIFGQAIAEVIFSLIAGQPLIILLTSAPLSIFIKVVYTICDDFDLDFYAMYCWVGLWNAAFLTIYAFFGFSRILKWSTRSTEEIFALFISVAFAVDAFKDMASDYARNYQNEACELLDGKASLNVSELLLSPSAVNPLADCRRDSSVLFTLLMFGTVWLGVTLYNFKKTPFLQAGKREALSDYALPIAVLVLSFFGSYVFRKVPANEFRFVDKNVFTIAPMGNLSPSAIAASLGLGFILSLLIFMDQNISAAMVNNPSHRLKKGTAYHWDLLVVAVLNAILSLFGFPWMHATIPHSPLHVRSLADVEERVDQGHVHEIIVKVRETRLTGMLSHILIGLSLLLLPYPLSYIPKAVLNGLFLYMAVTALGGNQLYERITLLFTEQAAYPPNHYIRRVPQKKIHLFTLCQLVQLLVMCGIGFSPMAYVKMAFPIVLLILLPVRHKLIPRVVDKKFLNALDGQHQ